MKLFFELTPNVFHVWSEVPLLTLTLMEGNSNMCNEYMFQFTSGQTPTTLTLPDTIIWFDGVPEIEPNMIYQCSILNNIGIICGV